MVFLRITVDGLAKDLSLKRSWEKSRWLPKAGRAAGTKEDARTLNVYLDLIRTKVYDARNKLIENNEPITARAIKNVLSGEAQRKKMFLEIFAGHNANIKSLVGTDYTIDTWEKYDRVYQFTKDFLDLKYNVKDINIYSLNIEFANEFYIWFRTIRKCSHNTSVKYIGILKTIILVCISNGWLINFTLCE